MAIITNLPLLFIEIAGLCIKLELYLSGIIILQSSYSYYAVTSF